MPRLNGITRSCCASLWAIAALSLAALTAHADTTTFAIEPQDLSGALKAFAVQSHREIFFAPELARGRTSHGVKGKFDDLKALNIILEGTGLNYSVTTSNAILVRDPTNKSESSRQGGTPTTSTIVGADNPSAKVAQADSVRNLNAEDANVPDSSSKEEKAKLAEIIVTGTHIAGAEPPSRVAIYTREDFDLMGVSNLTDFFTTLPQNVGNTSANTISAVVGHDPANNTVDANGINLRGFGNGATLVLLSGQRLAPGNSQGNIVDISMIPMSAIERVEVVADGASAIYGSDAVGGVVNLILRQDLEGAETRLRYGSDTGGDRQQYQASQTAGHNWGTGSALLVYEYDGETPLYASDRSFTDTAPEPFTLLPKQRRNSVFLTAQQTQGSGWELFGNATFSNRSGFNYATVTDSFSQKGTYNVDTYTAAVGATKHFAEATTLELTSNYSYSNTHEVDLYNAGDASGGSYPPTESLQDVTSIITVEGKLDGTLLTIPTGNVLYAIGAQFRRETYANYDFIDTTDLFSSSRKVGAAFAEAHIPLLGSSESSARGTLELTLADRYEHYSDFGNTNNPQVGIIWRPIEQLKIHSVYGTSFVAPVLSQLSPIPTVFDLSSAFNSSAGLYGANPPNVLIAQGGNPNLTPQKSRNWSVGLEFKANDKSGLSGYLDYYDLSYRDQISNLGALGFNTALYSPQILQDGNILGPRVINRNPSTSLLQQFMSAPTYVAYGGPFNPASGTVLIDGRWLNLSVSHTNGVDFGTSYKMDVAIGTWGIGVDGTYVFKFDNQISASAPAVSFLNLPYEPINLKLRGTTSLRHGPFTAAAFINYTNSYKSLNTGTEVPVASWLTVDSNLSYDFGANAGVFSKTALMLGATNLLNKAPPYVANYSTFPLNYDGVNANALARFTYIQLVKRW